MSECINQDIYLCKCNFETNNILWLLIANMLNWQQLDQQSVNSLYLSTLNLQGIGWHCNIKKHCHKDTAAQCRTALNSNCCVAMGTSKQVTFAGSIFACASLFQVTVDTQWCILPCLSCSNQQSPVKTMQQWTKSRQRSSLKFWKMHFMMLERWSWQCETMVRWQVDQMEGLSVCQLLTKQRWWKEKKNIHESHYLWEGQC